MEWEHPCLSSLRSLSQLGHVRCVFFSGPMIPAVFFCPFGWGSQLAGQNGSFLTGWMGWFRAKLEAFRSLPSRQSPRKQGLCRLGAAYGGANSLSQMSESVAYDSKLSKSLPGGYQLRNMKNGWTNSSQRLGRSKQFVRQSGEPCCAFHFVKTFFKKTKTPLSPPVRIAVTH